MTPFTKGAWWAILLWAVTAVTVLDWRLFTLSWGQKLMIWFTQQHLFLLEIKYLNIWNIDQYLGSTSFKPYHDVIYYKPLIKTLYNGVHTIHCLFIFSSHFYKCWSSDDWCSCVSYFTISHQTVVGDPWMRLRSAAMSANEMFTRKLVQIIFSRIFKSSTSCSLKVCSFLRFKRSFKALINDVLIIKEALVPC